MKKILLLLTLSGSIFLLGCKNNNKENAQTLLDLITQYGNEKTTCLAQPGSICSSLKSNIWALLGDNSSSSFEVLENAKAHADGRVIFTNNGWNVGGPRYFGINLNDFDDLLDSLKGLSDNQKANTILYWIFGSIEKLTPAGGDNFTFINDQGNPELYSENTSSIKDLEGLAAKLENQSAEMLSDKLSAQYGLSTDRADVVAKNIFAYNKLSSKRALTKKEKDFFANELLGANYDQVMNSFSSGVGVDNLLEKAADVNGTSPEQISAIVNELFL